MPLTDDIMKVSGKKCQNLERPLLNEFYKQTIAVVSEKSIKSAIENLHYVIIHYTLYAASIKAVKLPDNFFTVSLYCAALFCSAG